MTIQADWLLGLGGGALIGLAAAALLLVEGRVAGISGIVGGALTSELTEGGWRWAFLAGMLAGGAVAAALVPDMVAMSLDRSVGALVAAGVLVGFGTRLGGGCTSGHGVCGLSRPTLRSLVATMVFMATGMLAASAVGSALGGVL